MRIIPLLVSRERNHLRIALMPLARIDHPSRCLGATTLWAGTSTLYALRDRHGDEIFHDSIAGWFK